MPALADFSDNAFRTRSDLIRAGLALLKPLEPYKSLNHARIKIASATGAGFSDTAAQLEGFARPLWLVADFVRLEAEHAEPLLKDSGVRLETWVKGLKNGVDPMSPEYWGDVGNFDQRVVEMESIAVSLLTAPSIFGFPDDESARGNLIAWLKQINESKMPMNNWRWFRVLVNLALVQTLGVPAEEVQHVVDQDFELLDSFYLGGGWSSDGLWAADRKQADYYSGGYAIQFAQLLYLRFAKSTDPERAEEYRQQAGEFAASHWRYFRHDGAPIPFGRSMTYRTALGAFWAAAAAAGVELRSPVDAPGSVKGLVLRHLRWWASHSDIFNTDGTLSIGYAYPNMYMSEDYNSPQSVYWCLKTFLVAGLPEDSTFWASEELSHPLAISGAQHPLTTVVAPPRQILVNTPEHHFLLAAEQMSKKNHKSREAKYAKFAYSSSFGFSVAVGPLLEQIAPDNTLCVSIDDGESWRVHWEAYEVQFASLKIGSETVPTLASTWKPWGYTRLEFRTTLVAPCDKYRGWHVRLHHVRWERDSYDAARLKTLRLVDGGFAISSQTSDNVSVFERPYATGSPAGEEPLAAQSWWCDESGCLVLSHAGASGIVDLTRSFVPEAQRPPVESQVKFIKPDANTNLMAQRTLLPSAEHHITYVDGKTGDDGPASSYLVTGVFAVAREAGLSAGEVWDLWKNPPRGQVRVQDGDVVMDLE